MVLPDYNKLAAAGLSHKSAGRKLTDFVPFELTTEARGVAKRVVLEARLRAKEKEEAEAHNVHALPLRPRGPRFMPKPSDRPLTEVCEFHLEGTALHEAAERRLREQAAEEKRRAMEAVQIKALPLPAATYEPDFRFAPPESTLTVPVELTLASTARAAERQAWEHASAERTAAVEAEKAAQERAAKEAEEAELKRLRSVPASEGGFAFKARPMAWVDEMPLRSRPAPMALTLPVTPNLQTTKRAAARAACER
ncbi:unnamed protein product [Phaeothamnion confervicola]